MSVDVAEDSIKVFIRLRPLGGGSGEHAEVARCLDVTSDTTITIPSKKEDRTFNFDGIKGENSTQDEMFSMIGRGVVENCLKGYNGTIFAYGQTGSGKTYTMTGPTDTSGNILRELRGLMPRCFEHVFSMVNREAQKHGDKLQTLVTCSFLEIYNEKIFDLLDGGSTGLQIREDVKRGVIVKDLTELPISNALEACEVLKAGHQNRRVASTSMNRESSRSHAVFTVCIKTQKKNGEITNAKESKLNMIDLAGSERQRDTKADGSRLKEAGNINKSLSALGNVIMALVDIANGKHRHVAYRDSKLTFLLRDSLGGNTKTYMIANISPAARSFGETLSTLQFAQRAKMIKNKAVINEDISGSVNQLQEEIRRLKQQLMAGSAGPVQMVPTDGIAPTNDGLLVAAIRSRNIAEQEMTSLKDRLELTRELLAKKEKALQSTKMILKFRDTALSKMRKPKEATEAPDVDKKIKALEEEIQTYKELVENHPEVTRFAVQNLRLREEVKQLKEAYPSSGQENVLLQEARQYSLMIEKKVAVLIDNAACDESRRTPYATPVANRTRSRIFGTPSVETPRAKRAREVELEKFKVQKDLEEKIAALTEKSAADQKIAEGVMRTARERELELCAERDAITSSLIDLENTLKVSQMRHQMAITRAQDEHMKILQKYDSTATDKENSTRLQAQFEHVSSELTTTRTENADLKKERMNFEVSKNKLQQDYTRAESQLKATAELMEQTRTKFETAQAEAASVLAAKVDEINLLQSQISANKTQLAQVEERIEQANAQHEASRADLEVAIDTMRGEKEKLEAELVDAVDANQRLQETFDEERTQRMNFEDELSTANAEMDFKNVEIAKTDQQMVLLKENLATLTGQISTLKAELAAQKQSNQRLIEADSSTSEITRERDQLVVSVTESATALAELQVELAELQKVTLEKQDDLDEANRILADKTTFLAQQIEIVELGKAQIAALTEETESRNQEIADCRETISELTEQARIYAKTSDTLEETIATLNDQLEEEAAAHRSQLAEIMQELDTTHIRAKHADAALVQAEQTIDATAATSAELRTKSESLVASLSSLNVENGRMTNEIARLEEIISHHDATKAHLDTTQEGYLSEIAGLKTQLSDMSEILQTGEELKQDKAKEVSDLKATVADLKQRQAAFEEVQDRLSKLEESTQVEHAENAIEVAHLKETITQLQQKQQSAKDAWQEAELQNDTKIEELSKENAKLAGRMNMCEVNLDAALEDAEALVDELQRARDLEQTLYKEKEELQSKYEQSQESKLRVEEDYAKTQHQLNELRSEADKLIGHQNTSQKIQLHLQIKKENNSLKTEINKLKSQLKQAGSTVKRPLGERNALKA